MKYSHESLTSELAKLVAEKSASQQQIQLLEEDVKLVTEREKDGALEVERQDTSAHVCCQTPV